MQKKKKKNHLIFLIISSFVENDSSSLVELKRLYFRTFLYIFVGLCTVVPLLVQSIYHTAKGHSSWPFDITLNITQSANLVQGVPSHDSVAQWANENLAKYVSPSRWTDAGAELDSLLVLLSLFVVSGSRPIVYFMMGAKTVLSSHRKSLVRTSTLWLRKLYSIPVPMSQRRNSDDSVLKRRYSSPSALSNNSMPPEDINRKTSAGMSPRQQVRKIFHKLSPRSKLGAEQSSMRQPRLGQRAKAKAVGKERSGSFSLPIVPVDSQNCKEIDNSLASAEKRRGSINSNRESVLPTPLSTRFSSLSGSSTTLGSFSSTHTTNTVMRVGLNDQLEAVESPVLIIESNTVLLQVMIRIVQSMGFPDTLSAVSGIAGMKLVQERIEKVDSSNRLVSAIFVNIKVSFPPFFPPLPLFFFFVFFSFLSFFF